MATIGAPSTTEPKVRQELQKILSSEYRESVLDLRYHFLPLNLEIYEIVLTNALEELENQSKTATVKSILEDLEKFVKERHSKNPPIDLNDTKALPALIQKLQGLKTAAQTRTTYQGVLPAIVKKGEKVLGVLYKNYDATYEAVFRNYLNKSIKEKLSRSRYDQRKEEKKAQIESGKKVSEGDIPRVFDIGHMGGSEEYLITPSKYKVDLLVDEINKKLEEKNSALSADQRGVLAAIQSQVLAAQKDLAEKSSYGAKISSLEVTKDFGEFLKSIGAVLVVPQDALENRYLYGTKVEGKILQYLINEVLPKLNFSNNLIEDIGETLLFSLQGKAVQRTKKKKKITGIIKPVKTRAKVSISSSNPGKVLKTSGAAAPVPINTVKTMESSLTSLQVMLDTMLREQVKRNMGDGSRKDVLNYRTGRFADSVKVERLSESRQGMITAFYSYMKNPYATFSAGGMQQSPRSRDPKLLIARSIREIGAELAYNRMRAVLV